MDTYHFTFSNIDTLTTASTNMSKLHPDVSVLALPDTLTLVVEARNSIIFDSKIIAFITSAGGKLVEDAPFK